MLGCDRATTQELDRMKALLPFVAIACFLAIIGVARASAASGDHSCASIQINSATGNRDFVLDINSNIAPCPSGGTLTPATANAGSAFTYSCEDTTTGAIPPADADANGITVRAYADNTGFPDSTGGAPFFSRAHSPADCDGVTDFTFFCTADGTSGGSPRYGPVRLYIRALRTGVGAYDDNSDEGNQGTDIGRWGMARCDPKETSLSLTSKSVFVGGDTIQSRIILDASAYTNVRPGMIRIKCGSGGSADGAGGFDSSSNYLFSTTINTPNFVEGCTNLKANVSFTRTMAQSGWTTAFYANWNALSTDPRSNSSRDIEIAFSGSVSYIGSFNGINMTKCSASAPTCANVSAFIISLDEEFARAKLLRDANGDSVNAVNVTCQRTRPDLALESGVGMGPTDSSGNSPVVAFSVIAPVGTWSMSCVSSWSGNSASYVVSFEHVSSVTSGTTCAISWNETSTHVFNISIACRSFDPTTGELSAAIPDEPPLLTVQAFNHSQGAWNDNIVSRSQMIANTDSYSLIVTTNTSNHTTPLYAWATSNLTGFPTITGEYYMPVLSTIPTTIAVPLLIAGFAIALVAISFISTANPIPAFAALIGALIGWWQTYTNAASYFDEANLNAIMLLWVFVVIVLAMRSYLMAFKNKMAE